ncbi:MAG: tRNA pseudouridine(13) synthase TruD [Planctomycetaceae bacterium]|nr:tRNA pseudouridine(13) synthase TruD [Planctomycetaceae bacterium]
MMLPGSPPPYLTSEFPGVGGVLKHVPEDFVVEEIPLYEPCGEGEHLFLWVEKRDLPAELLTQHIARTLGLSRSEVGVAGLKDRRAITRQFVSVPARCADGVPQLETESVHVLRRTLHTNKLKTGHLRGNRFDVVIRESDHDAKQRTQPIIDVLLRSGFPNYYGDQRFGHENETLGLGLDLLTGRKSQQDIPWNRRKFLVRLALSSVQSAIFNAVLSERIADGPLGRVLPGDVMLVRKSGGPFVADDLPREQERFEQGETVLSGPMYGVKMRHPTGDAADREARALASFGLSPAHFARWRKLLPGTRRPLVAIAEDLQVEPHESGLQCRFQLSRGDYATVLLREIMKNDPSTEVPDEAPIEQA